MRNDRLLWTIGLAAAVACLGVFAGWYLWKWSRLPEGWVAEDPREAVAHKIDLGDIRIPPPGSNPVSLNEMHLPAKRPITIKGRILAGPLGNSQPELGLSFHRPHQSPRSAAVASYVMWPDQTEEGAAFRVHFHFKERDAGALTFRIEWAESGKDEGRLIAQGRATVTQHPSKANR